MILGSENPGKIKAVKNAMKQLRLQSQFMAIKVPSCIHAMPITRSELKTGALHRAKQAYQASKNEQSETTSKNEQVIGLGLEGGIFNKKGLWYLSGVTAGFDGSNVFVNHGFEMLLPQEIAKKVIDENMELGDVIDSIVQKQNTKHDEGAIYYLTKNTLKRYEVFTMEVIMVLSAFLNNGTHVFKDHKVSKPQ